ncbi:hypothetical protein [uncultured Corynebacterium sp.]|uniref:hypothetical protein n=1 Tax=uncultured Corynebacterium sp. TaxID=159447 RepID=UPI00259772D2|nr:hypothetical protein [uncultured Corynebacterium sp.]
MPKVTLARRWNPGVAAYLPGDVVEVDEATAEWLKRTGATVEGAARKPERPAAPVEPEAAASEPEEDPDEATGVTRPARTASVEVWRKFAEKQGIATKGLSKQELIAATK